MPMYYFTLRNTDTLEDLDGTELANASSAREHAIGVARELMLGRRGMMDKELSKWKMIVKDSAGDEVLSFTMADYDNGDLDR